MNRHRFQVGEFVLDPANRLLLRGDTPVPLSPKAFDALVYLVQNAGRLLTRDELMKALWPDSFVEEGNLSVHIFQVRKALGDGADGKAYIQTVPRKGYRFNGVVKLVDQPVRGLATAAPTMPDEFAPAAVGDKPPHTRWRGWKMLAGIGCLLALIFLVQRFTITRTQSRRPTSPTRLTSFSPELSVSAAAISPDGKTLAYTNSSGLFLEEISTKETRALPSLASGLRISHLSWFPDGDRLLAAGVEAPAQMPSVWMIPVRSAGESTRIGPYERGVVSRNGSQIALVKQSGGVKELWLLPVDGGQPRLIATVRPEEDLGSLFWSPGGQQLLLVCLKWNPQLRRNWGAIRSIDLGSGKSTEIFSAPDLSGDAVSLPGGRLLYGQLLGANPAGSYGGELRESRVDPRTGKVSGDSVSLGSWPEPVVGLSVSADGQRLVFRTVLTQHNVYEGDLGDNGKTLLRVRRLTFGKGRDDFPRAWTPDSKAIFFDSNRNGKWEIFKQGRNQIIDEPYLHGANDEFSPRISPDGRALLYIDRPPNWHESEPVSLMQIPIAGGFPKFVLQASGFSEWGLRFECARRSGGLCVLAQRTGSQIVFRPFNPKNGFDAKRSEVARIALDPNGSLSWALAPDGSHLAWIISGGLVATIHVISLHLNKGQSTPENREHEVVLKGVSHLHALNWSPDGEGWYVTTHLPASWAILHANLNGRIQVLWRGTGEYAPEAWPSPDGCRLAFSRQEQDSNVWMLENF